MEFTLRTMLRLDQVESFHGKPPINVIDYHVNIK